MNSDLTNGSARDTASEQEWREDQRLAAFTDELLEEGVVPDERPPLATTVELLAEVLRPQAPPAYLRRRLRRRIVEEFAQRQLGLRQRLSRWFRVSGRRRPLALAVAALALVAVGVVLLTSTETGMLAGTAGGGGLTVLLVAGALLAALVIGWLLLRR
jgi:hypothetical protein